jgi:hypothetical protein
MPTRSLTSLLGFMLVAFLLFSPVPASAITPDTGQGLSFPVHVQSVDQGVFTGTVQIRSFGAEGDKVFALGTLTGTLIDETGAVSAIVRTVSVPLILGGGAHAKGVAPQEICPILHLELGPLDLDLLGLLVHLDKVVLDISAESGAGKLLGNLLCAIVGLLDGSNLPKLAELLTDLVNLLT